MKAVICTRSRRLSIKYSLASSSSCLRVFSTIPFAEPLPISDMGLEGKTPAEAAGIKVVGSDKWLTLIQNAKRNDTK